MIEILLIVFILGLRKVYIFLSEYEDNMKLKAYEEKITQRQVAIKRQKGYSEKEIQDYIERRKQGFKY